MADPTPFSATSIYFMYASVSRARPSVKSITA
jgi:hypothetical protein